MTREQWAKLTPEEQRIKVAELCGWSDIWYSHEQGQPFGLTGYYKETKLYRRLVPHYLNDLNAMHEAEKLLFTEAGTEHLEYEFADWLGEIVPDKPTDITHWMVHATAAQRAEAFVLTMDERTVRDE